MKTMLRKVIASLLVLSMVCAAVPWMPQSTAYADPVTYPLWVGGVQVTDANKADILGDGTAKYYPEVNVLELTDASLTKTYSGSLIYAEDMDLTINAPNGLTLDNPSNGVTLYLKSSTNSHDLIINGNNIVIKALNSPAIVCGRNVTINGSTQISSNSVGINAPGIVTINGNATINSGNAPGITYPSELFLNGKSHEVNSEGMALSAGKITIKGDFKSSAEGNQPSISCQTTVTITGNVDITTKGSAPSITGQTVNITGNVDITSEGSYGIKAGAVTIEGAARIDAMAPAISVNTGNLVLTGPTGTKHELKSAKAQAIEVTTAGGTLTIEGDITATSDQAPAIYCLGNIGIKGNVNATTSGSSGILAKGNIVIDGDVTVTSVSQPAVNAGGSIEIKSGTWVLDGGNGLAIVAEKGITIPATHEIAKPEGAKLDDEKRLLLEADGSTPVHSTVIRLVGERSVTVTDDGNGTASASPEKGAAGTLVTLTATPKTGYQFKDWEVIFGGVTIENDQFEIGTADVEVKALFEEISSLKEDQELSFKDTQLAFDYSKGASADLEVKHTKGDGALSFKSSDETIAKVDDKGHVEILKVGTVTITATAAETENFNKAEAECKIIIDKGSRQNESLETVAKYGTEAQYDLSQYIETGAASTVATVDKDESAAIVESSVTAEGVLKYTIIGNPEKIGETAVIRVYVGESDCFGEYYIDITITVVDKDVQVLSFEAVELTKKYGDEPFINKLTQSMGDGEISYASSNPSVATVSSDGTVTIVNAGDATIVATAAETETFAATQASFHLIVEEGDAPVPDKPSSGGGGGVTTYAVKLSATENGNITASTNNAAENATVTITVTPDKGYVLDQLTVKDKNNDSIAVTEKGSEYSFKMPASPVEVTATFKAEAEVSADDFPFTDVPENAYFRKPVEWALKNGITSGTTPTTFGPFDVTTRGQMITFLWIAKGSPEPTSTELPFKDVAESAYYYKPVLWAYENGITAGVSADEFAPDVSVTRAQAVTFLYGVAGRPAAGSEPFEDVADTDWFAAPVAWAYNNGITSGTSATMFSPDAACQRAQIITFMAQYFAE